MTGAKDENTDAILAVAHKNDEAGAAAETGVILLNAADIKPEAIHWLWPGWLARRKLHILAGSPGTGKTTIALSWAATISAGGRFPDGRDAVPGRVLIWSGEDDFSDTLVPRLIVARADLSKIDFVGPVEELDLEERKKVRVPFDPARHIEALAKKLAEIDDLALIVIDPIVASVRGDSNNNGDVRRGLLPLVDLAVGKNAALLGITHYTKGTQGRDTLERVTGSVAWGGAARLVFGTVKQRQPEGEDAEPQFLIARAKTNIGQPGGGFAYQFELAEVEPQHLSNRIKWGEAVSGDSRTMFAEAEADPDDGEQDAASFLRQYLGDGRKEYKDVEREGRAAGYSPDQLKRAKKKARVKSEKTGMDTGWYWRLRDQVEPSEGRDVPF